MSQEIIEVHGTVRSDGSLALDKKLGLPAGRVLVTVRPCHASVKPDPVRFGALMERIWADQKARGHVARSREEIDAEVNKLRDEADEEMQAVERLHEECQGAGHQPYVARLPDGRYFAVEFPAGLAETDPLTGEVILQPPAIHLLDRLRALLAPLPANTTPGRIRSLRDALSLGRDELAALLHLEVVEVEAWESGNNKPTVEQLTALEQIRQRAVRAGVLLPEHAFASSVHSGHGRSDTGTTHFSAPRGPMIAFLKV